MPYTRPPIIGPGQPSDPNDLDAVAAEAERNKNRAELEILINAIRESMNEYDEDIVTFSSALPYIDAESPIVASAIERLETTISDQTYDENFNEVLLNARSAMNRI